MNIWLVNPGEPLPVDNNQRLLRTGKLAYHLKKRGHKIFWFSSKFNHFTKKFRKLDKKKYEGIQYYFIKSIGYKKNLSIMRLLDHFVLGINLFLKIIKMKKPDIVITSYPPIETSFFILIYCKINNIKLICDVRDLWPYTFQHLFKKKFYKVLCNIFVLPWVLMSKIIFKKCKIITISDGFSKWLSPYCKSKVETVFLSYEKKKSFLINKKFKNFKISKKDFIICFIGNFSEIKFNFDLVFNSSDQIFNFSKNIKFIMCGDLKNINQKFLKKYKNVYLFDWINRKEVRKLLSISSLGLAPYNDLWDFNLSIPNKISEYLSYDLPILSSLKGDTKNLINKHNCGINYRPENKFNFINNIKKIYSNKKLYKKMKINARSASENFHDEKLLIKMEKIIFN